MISVWSIAQTFPPLALAPGLDGIEVIFWIVLAFALLALLTPVVLHLNHRLEIWKGRKKDRGYNEELVKLAVQEGRLANEKKESDQVDGSS